MSAFTDAVEAFRKAQGRGVKFGACDTEPRGEFYKIVEDLAEGNEPKVPTSAVDWQLFTGEGQKGVGLAAAALTRAARKVVVEGKKDRTAVAQFVREW